MIEDNNKETKVIKVRWSVKIDEIDEIPVYYDDDVDEDGIPDKLYQYIHEQIENIVDLGSYDLDIDRLKHLEK